MNHMIRITPIRVIGPDNEQLGILDTAEAMRMAQEQGLDLVEVVPDTRPPVCKIMDYGKHRYEESKKQAQSRASSKQPELKEVRLGRSVKIDPHDVGIRIDQARRFLLEGHKVQFIQKFRGREIAHKDLGMENLREAIDKLGDIAKIELEPRLLGRQASMVLAPDKTKIDAIRRKEEQAAKAKAAEEAAALAKAEADKAAEEAKAQAAAEAEENAKGRKKKPSGDSRGRNPVDDEINALLGG